jgi:hypothetical protein
VGNTPLMNAKGRAAQGDADEQQLQKQTQFLRPPRAVFDPTNEHRKKLLQQPASLEITRLPGVHDCFASGESVTLVVDRVH